MRVYVAHLLYSSVDRHLSCFHIEALVNNATEYELQISLLGIDFGTFKYIPYKYNLRSEISGSYGRKFLIF